MLQLAFQVYEILKDVSPEVLGNSFKRKNLIFLNSLLVTPNSARVREFGQSITVVSVNNCLAQIHSFIHDLYMFFRCFCSLMFTLSLLTNL